MRYAAAALIIGLFAIGPGGLAQTQPIEAVQTFVEPSRPVDGWVARSESDVSDDGDQSTPDYVYRLKGDATSRYYYVEWSNDSFLRDEAGHLLAHWRDTPDFSARRSATRVVLYFVTGHARRLTGYGVVAIEHGRARRWECTSAPGVAGPVGDTGFLQDADHALLRELAADEPALVRDHCTAIDTGAGRDQIVRPALRLAFPQVGDVFREDERGLRGGWLYQGSMSCNKQPSRNCWVSQYLSDERMAFIVQVASGRGPQRRVRVTHIFYADPRRVKERDCTIGQDYPVAGISDADGQGGEIYFTNGQRVWSLRWRDALPTQCAAINE
ncbi:MAG: hypothetical protein V4475_22720 [Pseudomonadota bacterium]